MTPLQRPEQFADAETLTAEQAAQYEASTAADRVDDRYYWDRGTRVVEDRPTSLIIDPPNGRMPPLTRIGQQRPEASRNPGTDGPEQRNASERCLTRTLPRLPGRIVPLDGRPHVAEPIRQWNGDSRAHWEGDTLVIDTTNFTGETKFQGSAERLHPVERLTRTSRDTIDYRFTATDPTTWTQPWTAQIPFNRNDGPLYE